MKKLGILFDMDGVLVDSEPVITAAACEALNRFGVPAKLHDFKQFTGMGENRFLGGVCEMYDHTYTLPMKALCYDIYGELVDAQLKIYDGTKPMLQALTAQNRKMALASSADLIKVRHNLRVAGIPFETFGIVLTGDDVERKKPYPDIYLKAAQGLGLPASDCVVVEDAVSGVQAGKAAGAYVIAVTTTFSAEALIAAAREISAAAKSQSAAAGAILKAAAVPEPEKVPEPQAERKPEPKAPAKKPALKRAPEPAEPQQESREEASPPQKAAKGAAAKARPNKNEEIAQYAAQGMSKEEIARTLGISTREVSLIMQVKKIGNPDSQN